MANKTDGLQGLNLLSFDGGGITGLSSLYIVREIMDRIQAKEGLSSRPEPWEYFDLIAGTGTGAVSAIMLGRLKLRMDDAIRLYHQLMSNTFSAKKRIALSTGFKATQLEEGLRNIVLYATGNAEEMLLEEKPQDTKCKVVVYAMSAHNMNASLPCAFRTYPANANVMPDCPIWKALRASMAHPELFKSVEIEEQGLKHQFVGGALGCNNPTAELLKEASILFPTRFVSSVTSVGTGHAQMIQLPKPSRLELVLPFGESLTLRLLRAARGIAEDSEKVAEDMAIRFSHTSDFYFRLNVNQGMQSIEPSDWEKQSAVASHARAYLRSTEVDNCLKVLANVVRERRPTLVTTQINGRVISSQEQNAVLPNTSNDSHLPNTSTSTKLKYCPRPTFMFKGRKPELEKARQYFENQDLNQHVFVLHGLGGAGKTQTALKCAELMIDRFEGILFIDGSSRGGIETALCQLAIAKGIGKEYTDMLQWFEQRPGRWLLLFDNVDDPGVRVHEYFPRADRYDVLITTRHKTVARQARGQNSDYKVDEMNPDEALELLLEAARLRRDALEDSETAAASSLLQDFGYLALAIVQSGAFICRTQCAISQYYRMYLDERQEILEGGETLTVQLDDYERSIFTTWALNKPITGTPTEKLWKLVIYMHKGGISEKLFQRAYENLEEYKPKVPPTESESVARREVAEVLKLFSNKNGIWSSRLFFSAMGELVCFSMIELDTVNNVYHLHPLVQQWARSVTHEPNAAEKTSYLLALSINAQRRAGDHAYKRMVLPHVSEILTLHPTPNSNDAWQFASVFSTLEHSAKAETLELFVVETRAEALGPEDVDTILSMEHLALTKGELGQLEQAEERHARVLYLRRRVLGEDHPDTLSSMVNLANTYRDQGRLNDAEQVEVEVLAARKRVLGDDHPHTLWSKGNLAVTYRNQGRLADAELLETEVLATRKRVLGEDHSDTVSSMVYLANTYRDQGRLSDAESLEVKVLAARRRTLGNDHPDTLLIMGNLAVTYRNQGRLKDAELLQAEVLSVRKRLLGEGHLHTLLGMMHLANTHRDQGRLNDAEKLEVEVLAARRRTLGNDHPDTLLIMGNLAVTYRNQGRLKDAELLQAEVLSVRKRVLGEDHPHTLLSMMYLANTHRDQGRLNDAEKLEVEVLAARRRTLGSDHPDTLLVMGNLAVTYRGQGRLKDAELLQVEVLTTRKRVLGDDHPGLLTSMVLLANIYREQARLADAEKLDVEVLATRRQTLGNDHPETLLSMENLALTYCNQGRLTDAESLQVEALATRKRVLGEEHPLTLSSMLYLANTYRDRGLLNDAEQLEVKTLEIRRQTLGDDHPDTLLIMGNLAVTHRSQGRLEDAEKLATEALSNRKRVLGEEHPHTLLSMAYLANIYRDQGRLDGAELLEVECLATRKRLLGEDHPDTLVSMRNLALTYQRQGQHDRYEALVTEANAIEAKKSS